MSHRQTKAKCSNIYCLEIFPEMDAVSIQEKDGTTKIYCPLCSDSEIVRLRRVDEEQNKAPNKK
jgi:hypothetical protein